MHAEQRDEPLVVDLRGRSVDSKESLWEALMAPCGLPDWFGRNLDAWIDTLRRGISSTIDAHPLIIVEVTSTGLFSSGDPYGASFVEATVTSGKGRVEVENTY